MSTKGGSKREVAISGGTSLVAGQLVVGADDNKVYAVPSNQSASSFASSLGQSGVKTADVTVRTGAFSDTGKPIFED